MKDLLQASSWAVMLYLMAGSWSLGQTREKLLILGPQSGGFKTVSAVISREVNSRFEVVNQEIKGQTKYAIFEESLNRQQPAFIILMDNRSIEYYRHYQVMNPSKRPFPPSVACMALFIPEATKDIENALGISYELPPVVMLTQLRHKILQPIERVGVIYRDSYTPFIKRHEPYCLKEEIELISYVLPNNPAKLEQGIRSGLKYLMKKAKVDAIWVLNDSKLLQQKYVDRIWIPKLKYYKKPVVVSIEKLSQEGSFGNFAVFPDHDEIGHQVVDMIFNHLGEKRPTGSRVEEPRSVITFFDRDFARKYLGLVEEGQH